MNLLFDGWYKKKKSDISQQNSLTNFDINYRFRLHGFFSNFMPLEGFDDNDSYFYFDHIGVFLYTDNHFNEVSDRLYIPYYNGELIHTTRIPEYLTYAIDKEIPKLPF